MDVIQADRSHLPGVSQVLHAAFFEAYSGLLQPETIAEVLANDYAPRNLKRRLLEQSLVVAVTLEDVVVGCAIATEHDDHVEVPVLVTDPGYRHRGVGGRLLARLRNADRSLPMCVNVLLGSIEGEQFVEDRGFVPGETIERVLGTEQIVERRWWLSAE